MRANEFLTEGCNTPVIVVDVQTEYSGMLDSAEKVESILRENNINPGIRTCPHCGKTGQTSNMLRWHFNNCKSTK